MKSQFKASLILPLFWTAAVLANNNNPLPIIQPPHGFEEGVETQLSEKQVSEILPWAQNSEIALKDLLDTVKSLNLFEAKPVLKKGIEEVVLASAPKQTELLMRYILNRALKVNEEIEQNVDLSKPGVVDIQVRLLQLSIGLALDYYQSDVAFLNGQAHKRENVVSPPFAQFGMRYSHFLMGIDNSLYDAPTQYNIAVIAMGLLQWDLYRDTNKMAFAPSIAKIQNTLRTLPERLNHARSSSGASGDLEAIKNVRIIKAAYKKAIVLAQATVERLAADVQAIRDEETRIKNQEDQARLDLQNRKKLEEKSFAERKAAQDREEEIKKRESKQSRSIDRWLTSAPAPLNLLKVSDFQDAMSQVNRDFFGKSYGIIDQPVPGCGDGVHSSISGDLHGFGDIFTTAHAEAGYLKVKQAAVGQLVIILSKKTGTLLGEEASSSAQRKLEAVIDFQGDPKPQFRYSCNSHRAGEGIFLEANSVQMVFAYALE